MDQDEIKTPWGEIGYLIYKRTYARPLKNGKTEEFTQSISRVIKACNKQLKVGFTQEEEERVAKMMLNLKGLVAGRFLWQLGTRTVDDLGLMSLQNCALTLVNEPIKPFVWTMDSLMLGVGVGFNIQREYVYEIPKVLKQKIKIERKDTNDADFIVPDSREGWVELLERSLKAHFETGKGFSYSTVCVRSKGQLIKGFGGVSSGPDVLCWGIDEINKILNNRAGKKLRPIDCLDIMNIIGFIVVAGNIRRSAQIAIGDADDLQYLNAKRWDLDSSLPKWRGMSNNSVVCNDFSKLPDQFWEGYLGDREPYGLINLKLLRSCGRLGETQYPDPLVVGVNPCAEQGLADKETCDLAEIFLPFIESLEEFKTVAEDLYRINKHSLVLKCHCKETEDIVHQHMRMGIGLTGFMQASEEQIGWCSEVYEHLREYDLEYSAKHGFEPSIKLTTIKPSGTLSLLPGVTHGGHAGIFKFFIRTVRIASDSPMILECEDKGYPIEFLRNIDGTEDRNTKVVSFPCRYPDNTILAEDLSAVDQLENGKKLQTIWSDNSVSCTIYYKLEELPEIKEWMSKNYNDSVKSCSFLLHRDHGFDQAPYQEITEEEYNEMKKKVKPITSCNIAFDDVQDNFECSSGSCPVR